MNIQFPILIYYNGKLFADAGATMKATGGHFTDEGNFSHMEYRANEKNGWLLEYNGKFHKLTPNGKKHESLRPLKFLWNFVKSEFSVETINTINVKELTEIVLGSKQNVLSKNLLKFLSSRNEDEVITQEILKQWLL